MRETVDEDRASVISYFVETAKVHLHTSSISCCWKPELIKAIHLLIYTIGPIHLCPVVVVCNAELQRAEELCRSICHHGRPITELSGRPRPGMAGIILTVWLVWKPP